MKEVHLVSLVLSIIFAFKMIAEHFTSGKGFDQKRPTPSFQIKGLEVLFYDMRIFEPYTKFFFFFWNNLTFLHLSTCLFQSPSPLWKPFPRLPSTHFPLLRPILPWMEAEQKLECKSDFQPSSSLEWESAELPHWHRCCTGIPRSYREDMRIIYFVVENTLTLQVASLRGLKSKDILLFTLYIPAQRRESSTTLTSTGPSPPSGILASFPGCTQVRSPSNVHRTTLASGRHQWQSLVLIRGWRLSSLWGTRWTGRFLAISNGERTLSRNSRRRSCRG